MTVRAFNYKGSLADMIVFNEKTEELQNWFSFYSPFQIRFLTPYLLSFLLIVRRRNGIVAYGRYDHVVLFALLHFLPLHRLHAI